MQFSIRFCTDCDFDEQIANLEPENGLRDFTAISHYSYWFDLTLNTNLTQKLICGWGTSHISASFLAIVLHFFTDTISQGASLYTKTWNKVVSFTKNTSPGLILVASFKCVYYQISYILLKYLGTLCKSFCRRNLDSLFICIVNSFTRINEVSSFNPVAK